MRIFLAGDSLVKGYEKDEFIGGWGQYLEYFFEKVIVYNFAEGGRSTRSFINEGTLGMMRNHIVEGDYLFVEFGHNDDETKSPITMPNRLVPLGEPDENGIYPTTEGKYCTLPFIKYISCKTEEDIVKLGREFLEKEYTELADDDAVLNMTNELLRYGMNYYSYDCGGSFKWYLKQYIDMAREKGAIPVLITPVARRCFKDGKIVSTDGMHGKNFGYIEAVRQLAREEKCLLIDLFEFSKKTLELLGEEKSRYLMSVKEGMCKGNWPLDYEYSACCGNAVMEDTHTNRYFAYILSEFIAQSVDESFGILNDFKRIAPRYIEVPPKFIVED